MSAEPELLFDHGLDIAKGWFHESALDFAAKLSANVDFVVPRGRVVHANADGEFETGAEEEQMAIFLLNGSADLDVSNPGGTRWFAVAPTGVMSGVVATGSYEIESTEFDDTRTYAPNQLLTAPVDNADIDVGGLLTNAGSGGGGDVEQFVDNVCGVVSRGRFVNAHQVPVLAFWPVWLPGAYT